MPELPAKRKTAAFHGLTLLALIGLSLTTFAIGRRLLRKSTANVARLYAPMYQRREKPLNYTLIPGWKGSDHDVEIAANRLGVRDDEWPDSPQEGLRVLTLGDSQTFGVGIPFPGIFAQRLQSALRADSPSARVFNAGVAGWNFDDEMRFLVHYWPRIQPQLVVVLFISNDLDTSITAGPSHQLMAPHIPFEPFFDRSDAWVMESFANATLTNPNLTLSLDNAMKEAWRVPVYDGILLQKSTSSGEKQYEKYTEDLRQLKAFLSERGSELLILVHNTWPGNRMESTLKEIYEREGISHLFLSSWLGDSANYVSRWANVPVDMHGNAAYHGLLASLIQSQLSSLPIGRQFHVPPPGKLEPKLPEPELRKFTSESNLADRQITDAISGEMTWSRPSTLKPLLARGGEYSQLRIVLKPDTDSGFLSIGFQDPRHSAETSPAIWVDLPGFRGFVPAAWDGSRAWGRLPYVVHAHQAIELGLVAGMDESGVFKERYPVNEIKLLGEAPTGLAFSTRLPGLLWPDIQGLAEDRWMGSEVRLRIQPQMASNGYSGLLIDGEGLPVPGLYPIRLSAITGEDSTPSSLTLDRPGAFHWSIPFSRKGPGALEILCDKTFSPNELDTRSMDRRKLCVRVLHVSLQK